MKLIENPHITNELSKSINISSRTSSKKVPFTERFKERFSVNLPRKQTTPRSHPCLWTPQCNPLIKLTSRMLCFYEALKFRDRMPNDR